MALELKGIIVDDGSTTTITCCKSYLDIKIGDVDLHEFLLENFNNTDVEERWTAPGDTKYNTEQLSIRYIIKDYPPETDMDFEELAAKVIVSKFDGTVTSEYITGCYSEYTCGYGGFDFDISGDIENNLICNKAYGECKKIGHNIFTELASHSGKYIHIKFTD